ncbi:hypothetical protein ABBQ32_000182 [Trebouxia sp. C0010 RCD-2024]
MVVPVHAGSGTADTAVNVAEESLTRLGWLKLDDDIGASHESVHARRDAHILPFEAISSDGGEFSEAHSFKSVCIDDQSCYSSQIGCRRSEAVNVTARYSGCGRCTVDAVTIRNPMRGYDSPVGQAIIFASLGVPKLESISNFDYIRNEADYLLELDRWNQQAHTDPTIPKPVAFVNMHGKFNATTSAPISRSSKYLIVKLLRAQGSRDNNIDVEFVGAHGWSGRYLSPCRMVLR